MHPASITAQQTAKAQQMVATSAPKVQETALIAQKWFEQASNTTDPDKKLRCYSEAIRLDPDDALAYNNRGLARIDKGDLDGALRDCDEAIRLNPEYAIAYITRGDARRAKGDLDGASKDYEEARRLKRETRRSDTSERVPLLRECQDSRCPIPDRACSSPIRTVGGESTVGGKISKFKLN